MQVPAIIDVEASGFGKDSYPIEVAYALEDKQIVSHLIRPQPQWQHWCEQAQSIHGISREQLFAEGKSAREIALILNQNLAGKTLYSDAWGFDNSWVARLFDAASLVPRLRIDTLNRLLSPEQTENWHFIKQGLWQELALTRHRAADDVQVLQETYVRVKSRYA